MKPIGTAAAGWPVWFQIGAKQKLRAHPEQGPKGPPSLPAADREGDLADDRRDQHVEVVEERVDPPCVLLPGPHRPADHPSGVERAQAPEAPRACLEALGAGHGLHVLVDAAEIAGHDVVAGEPVGGVMLGDVVAERAQQVLRVADAALDLVGDDRRRGRPHGLRREGDAQLRRGARGRLDVGTLRRGRGAGLAAGGHRRVKPQGCITHRLRHAAGHGHAPPMVGRAERDTPPLGLEAEQVAERGGVADRPRPV